MTRQKGGAPWFDNDLFFEALLYIFMRRKK